MKKEQIIRYLKNICPSAKLPSKIDVELLKNCFFINIKGKGIGANMRTDESAFEGRNRVLKAALSDIEHIILNWKEPVYTVI